MRAFLTLVASTVGFSATIVCARADDGAELLAKIRAATASATSFVARARTTNGPGVGATFTVVLPANVKSEWTFGSTSIESYAVDGMVYLRVPDGGWQKTKADETWLPARYVDVLDRLQAPRVTVLPDRKANRAVVGAFAAEVLLPATPLGPAPPSPQPIVCTYEKSSFLMRECTSSGLRITYSNYNDPANAVVLPDEAKNAVLVIHRAAPAASDPGPASSDTPAPAASSAPRRS